jgi:hypothetical protein
MAGPNDDRAVEDEAAVEEYERLHEALLEQLEEFMDVEGVDEDLVTELLVDAALHLRMTAYGMDTEQPSAAGLKLDLDHFGHEIEDLINDAKKGAEGYIEQVKKLRAEQGGGDEDE